ncbi:23S rRNA (uracil(1939)-C(5))-methyltransferase RlmD [Mycoplasmatota bacterium]|nr:23S rRNA (uracil(1939)-C(5))-methyltransferase RlmD [Mycoplasmatota bacterium]
MLTVGRQITIEVIDLDFKGQGVSRHEGYVIFTPGLLVGEQAIVEIEKIKKSFANANIVEILKVSKKRVHDSSMLGSIELYHLNVDDQIKWQEKVTRDTFSKIAQINVDLMPTITDQRFTHYRNKSVFHVLDEPMIKVGMYLKNYLLTETQQFVLSDKVTNKFLNLINRSMIPVEKNVLKHIVFRSNEKEEILITFVSTKEEVKGLDLLVKRLSAHEEVQGITLNIKDHQKRILGSKSIVLYGKNLIRQSLNQFELPINDRSFFQINFPVMKKTFNIIKQHLMKDVDVTEAYSGIGVIGLSLLDHIKTLTMIESNHENVLMAENILNKYNIDKVSLIEARAEDIIEEYQADVLIVDPPRQGLMPKLIDKIKDIDFKQIIYVSCDVKTLARDYQLLSEKYDIAYLYPIRMFHHTISIETLMILNKKNN